MKNKLTLGFLLLIVIPIIASGQDTGTLSLKDAVEIALEENHSITISRNLEEIDENSATIGNAGYLPILSLNSSYSESIEDTRLEFPNRPGQDVSGSRSNRLNASIDFQWVLFDGFGNRYRLKSLKQGAELGAVQTRREIELTLLQVIELYLNVNTQAQLLVVTREAVEISNQRYRRALQNYEAGGGSRVDLLNAEVSLNQDSIRVVETELSLNRAKRNLQVLLGADPSMDVAVDDDVEIDDQMSLDTLLHAALSENARLNASEIETEQARLQLQQSRAARYPQISTSASYNYNRFESDAGQFTFQETDGFSAGLSFSFSLFDGFRRNLTVQNNKIRLKNSEEQKRLTEKNVRSEVLNAYETYTTNLFLLEKQQLNVDTAELNFERTELAFEQGQVTNTDFREAQLNLLETRQNLISLRVQAKFSEIDLLQLSGQLLTDIK
ncbi:TolC family protein [Rhodohalobacter sp. 8-1]|uniref:TolC family protein n=1 Tax=Rhodohalobacter sp. 8-1 TaxID=3131972 RepID=UPI0030ED63DB